MGGKWTFKTAAFNRSATHPVQAIQVLTMPPTGTKRGSWHPIGTRAYAFFIAASIALAATALAHDEDRDFAWDHV
jgi:hypothetical protein